MVEFIFKNGSKQISAKIYRGAGQQFKLADFDPADKGQHENHQSAAAEIARHTEVLARLQYKLYAEGKRSLLIVLQGLDASGKDGVIRHVMTGTNPQRVNVTCFKQPTHCLRRHLRTSGLIERKCDESTRDLGTT